MYEIEKILKELDRQIENQTNILKLRPGMAWQDFIGVQANVRMLESIKQYIIDDIVKPQEEQEEGNENGDRNA